LLEYVQAAFDCHQLHFFSALQPLADPQAFAAYLAPVRATEWVVYAKPPFGSPQQVLEYLGRYTHRVAIANHRLVGLEKDTVTFRWKDYRHHNKPKLMTLPADEFLRRFLLHVLPDGFQRIRYYGFLGNRHRATKLAHCRQLLAEAATLAPLTTKRPDYRAHYEQLTGRSLEVCPICQQGRMMRVELLQAVVKDDLGSRGDTS
jgi:putative transposase